MTRCNNFKFVPIFEILHFVQVLLEGLHNQKIKSSVTALLIGLGSIAGVTLLLLQSYVLWKVCINIFNSGMIIAFIGSHSSAKVAFSKGRQATTN